MDDVMLLICRVIERRESYMMPMCRTVSDGFMILSPSSFGLRELSVCIVPVTKKISLFTV